MLQHIEGEFRRQGKRNLANKIASIHKENGSDILFPAKNGTLKQTEPKGLITPEIPVEIKRFSQEAREALEQQGFTLLELTGRSIKILRENPGHKIKSTWHNLYPDFEALPSMHSEVAINRNELFLPKSQGKTYDKQVIMVEEFSKKLSSRIPGVEVIMGEVPDYLGLAFAHLDKTQGKNYLFGESDNYNYTRTKTPVYYNDVANVGYFSVVDGLRVDFWGRGHRSGGLGVAPLVVPTSK